MLALREKLNMSGGMGYYSGDLFDENGDPVVAQQQTQQQQQGNGLRDHLKKVEDQNTALQEQVAKLVAQQRQVQIADELQAKGYSRAVAGLYAGEPEKLDEWLTNVGPLLAKDQTVATGTGQAGQQGQVPASSVPADGQAALQQMQQAGQNAAGPQGSEAEQIAQMRQAQTPEALMQYLQGQGNPYHFNG